MTDTLRKLGGMELAETQTTPEKRLWAAVLLRAIRDYVKGKDGACRVVNPTDADTSPKQFKEADEWLGSDAYGEGTFIWACEVLDLPVDKTRKAILALTVFDLRNDDCRLSGLTFYDLKDLVKKGAVKVARGEAERFH